MSDIITNQGQFILDLNDPLYLVNNFTKTNSTSGWTFGGTSPTLSNGVEILTGTSPNITSATFTVNPNDIICFEFTVALPTPSTSSGGPGLYLGTQYGQSVYVHTFNHSTKVWGKSTSATTNPYFIYAYNLTATIYLKCYILGSSVDLNDVPYGESTNTSYPARAIQLPSGTTTTYIRSGYNTNTSMVIHFSNPKIYDIKRYGFCENNSYARFGKNWSQANNFYEY